ncbi:hypothetical protein SAMN02745136_04928 [Anaerocolumna jejuensis DSM 15929]|uniref:Uncharacterized protein n=1 Tax=Anaerocolumna jejuensis DSM 15929 TaxID=1121322 RepID=A0A1M7AQI0_9FIRM|nr:hypothetical protein SAMN02745136_04928 [Anaerocolumna jejuensis DSM 15929]
MNQKDMEEECLDFEIRNREVTECLMNDISQFPHFVMSGQMWSIRKTFNPLFDLAVFITAPTEICVERYRLRALKRWGNRVLLGGGIPEYPY